MAVARSSRDGLGEMRTNVYVDAFNFYFGCLKGTPYKWLNLTELARRSMPASYRIHRVGVFAALVQPRPQDPQQGVRQRAYFRGLETVPDLTIHLGQFLVSTVRMPLARPTAGWARTVEVLRTEEKGSDVNLATYLLVDAFDADFEPAVVISDDSDLAEPVHIVRKKFGRHVTILSPRGRSRRLQQVPTRFRAIREEALRESQFPTTLTDAHGTIRKPANW